MASQGPTVEQDWQVEPGLMGSGVVHCCSDGPWRGVHPHSLLHAALVYHIARCYCTRSRFPKVQVECGEVVNPMPIHAPFWQARRAAIFRPGQVCGRWARVCAALARLARLARLGAFKHDFPVGKERASSARDRCGR